LLDIHSDFLMLKDDDYVQHVADKLNVSTKYLSSSLKQLTGQTTNSTSKTNALTRQKKSYQSPVCR